jgi:hypothetical protein
VTQEFTSEYIAIIDNPEELNCGADYSWAVGAMGIGWDSVFLKIDPESHLRRAYSL